MGTRREFFKTILGGAGLVILGSLIGVKKSDAATPDANPYQYDLGALKKIPAKMITHKEVSRIKVRAGKLYAVALDPAGQLFVSADKKIFQYNKNFDPSGGFDVPEPALCMSSDKKDELFLGMANHLEKSSNGIIERLPWSLQEDKAFISGVAVKGDFVCIAETRKKQVEIYSKDGKLKRTISGFLLPGNDFDVAFNDAQSLWVTNPGKLRLEKYNMDGKRTAFWGKASFDLEGFSGCNNPVHFTLLPDGNIVTVEKGLIRVKTYDSNGKLLGVVAGPESFNENTSGLDIACDSRSRIYIADQYLKSIRIFVKK